MKTIESLPPLQTKYRKSYLTAVLTPYTATSKMEAIYDTWGRDVPGIKFFTHDSKETQQLHSEGMPVIQLNQLTITSSKWAHLVAVMEFVYQHYYDDYSWLLLSLDDIYVNGLGFHELVSRLSPESDVYLGYPVVPAEGDSVTYCKGQQGILLSRALLKKLVTNFHLCQEEAEVKWDQRLGHCIKSLVNLQCGENLEEVSVLTHVLTLVSIEFLSWSYDNSFISLSLSYR